MIELLAAIALQSGADAPGWRRPVKDPYARCVCESDASATLVRFRGSAQDAVVSVGPGGRKPADRQATLFALTRPVAGLASPVKVFHATAPANCGVSFDYGKIYDVVAVKTGDELETSYCLMPKE